MSIDTRIQLSLVWRMLVAVVVLTVISILIAATGILVGGFLAWLVLLPLAYVVDVLLLPFLDGQYGFLHGVLSNPVRITVVCGIPLLPVLYYRPVRNEILAFQRELGKSGTPASETHPELSNAVRRLAQQANIPEPEVFVADRRRPESYALGGRSSGTIIVTTGLVRRLSEPELNAVLAHEISHLVNGDSRIMNLVLVPMLVAEHVGSDEPPTRRTLLTSPLAYLAHLFLWALVRVVTRIQRLCCQFGIAVLSRGRELAADRGAARLTGSPSDLASALETLEDGRGRPVEDKRTWEQSASVLDILPREESAASRGPFRTHPRIETRIDRLEALVVEMVAGDR